MSPKAPKEIRKIGWVFNHISARYPKINPAAIIEVNTEPTPINNKPGPLVLFMLLTILSEQICRHIPKIRAQSIPASWPYSKRQGDIPGYF